MEGTRTLALFTLALLQLSTRTDAVKCSMRGFCDKENKLPCAYLGVPKPVEDEEARGIFKEICGNYFKEPTGELCCDADQIRELANQFNNVERLGLRKCEACFANFQKVLCNMVCSTHQGDHVQATKKRGDVVESISYYADYRLLRGMYESCINVNQFRNSLPLSFALCGQDFNNCTMDLWYGALGKRSAGLSSVDVTYVPLNQDAVFSNTREYRPFKDAAYACNETVAGRSCSCEDCEAVCVNTNDALLSHPQDQKTKNPNAPAGSGVVA